MRKGGRICRADAPNLAVVRRSRRVSSKKNNSVRDSPKKRGGHRVSCHGRRRRLGGDERRAVEDADRVGDRYRPRLGGVEQQRSARMEMPASVVWRDMVVKHVVLLALPPGGRQASARVLCEDQACDARSGSGGDCAFQADASSIRGGLSSVREQARPCVHLQPRGQDGAHGPGHQDHHDRSRVQEYGRIVPRCAQLGERRQEGRRRSRCLRTQYHRRGAARRHEHVGGHRTRRRHADSPSTGSLSQRQGREL